MPKFSLPNLSKARLFFLIILILSAIIVLGAYLIQTQRKNPQVEAVKKDILTQNGGLKELNPSAFHFTGQITRIEKDYFILTAKNQTIKVIIRENQTRLRPVPFTATSNNLLNIVRQDPEILTGTDLRKGDFVDVAGPMQDQILIASMIIKYTER